MLMRFTSSRGVPEGRRRDPSMRRNGLLRPTPFHYVGLVMTLAVFPAFAETFKVTIKGSELKNLTALEFKLIANPEKSFLIEEGIEVFDLFEKEDKQIDKVSAKSRVLFKVVDSVHDSIRIFFLEPSKVKAIEIDGNLIRSNFSGNPEIKITDLNYISDFSLNINPKKLDTKIEIGAGEEALPYKGISKAEILGPLQRIFNPNMFITIGNIETYGFVINGHINHFKINGQEARLIDDHIIAARLTLDPENIPETLPIVLEIEVDNQTVRKDVGAIEFFENLN